MVRLSKRVMRKLRYEYNLGEIEREKFIEEQAVTEDQLKELVERQKQAGQRVRMQERESEGGTKWIKGLPSRSRRVNAASEEESEEEPEKRRTRRKRQGTERGECMEQLVRLARLVRMEEIGRKRRNGTSQERKRGEKQGRNRRLHPDKESDELTSLRDRRAYHLT